MPELFEMHDLQSTMLRYYGFISGLLVKKQNSTRANI